MRFENVILDNGLQIIAEVNESAFSQSLGFFVKTGSRDETQEMAGVSHFLEHMVFKGTQRRTAEQVNRELDELGSQSNAYTSEEQTVYYISILPEQQEHAVDLLTDLMRPSLRDDDFETERQVIIEEIAMYDDAPPYGAMERCMEEFFQQHPLSIRVLGTPNTVSSLDTDAMREYHHVRYAPDNLCFAAAGAVDFDRLVEQLKRLTDSWKPSGFQRKRCVPEIGTRSLSLQHPPAVQQYTVQLRLGPGRDSKDRFAFRLMATAIGDDCGSRLFWALVDPGLAESAALFAQEFDECGLLGLYLTCAPEVTRDNWQRMLDVVQEASDKPITSREVEIARKKICSGLILASERPSNRLFSIGNAMTLRNAYETIDQAVAKYEGIGEAEVNRALKYFQGLPSVLVTVGPEMISLK